MVEASQRDATFGLEIKAGEFFYICGVSHSFSHARNFHLAGVVRDGDSCSQKTAAGKLVSVHGMAKVTIDPGPARELFPELGREYLACRNFQFGCQMFGKSRTGSKVVGRQPSLF
jgi:hypothetical protein